MKYYAGLDISLKETAICVIDGNGDIVKEAMVFTEPENIIHFLRETNLTFERIGFETGNLSSWLYQELDNADFPVICMEARHASGLLKAQRIKTDKNDARGLAQIVRSGWYKAVHIKSKESQKLRVLLNNRNTLLVKKKDIDNQIRGMLKIFGLKIGKVSAGRYEARVRELLDNDPELLMYFEPLLQIRAHMQEQLHVFRKMILKITKEDEICRRFMSVPGVGVLTSLAFKATIDRPERFRRSRDVGAHLGLTPRKYASGEIDYNGRISKCGDNLTRSYLYEAAQTLMRRLAKRNTVKEWGYEIARRSSMKNACVAVARKISVILHRLWIDGTEYQDDFDENTPVVVA